MVLYHLSIYHLSIYISSIYLSIDRSTYYRLYRVWDTVQAIVNAQKIWLLLLQLSLSSSPSLSSRETDKVTQQINKLDKSLFPSASRPLPCIFMEDCGSFVLTFELGHVPFLCQQYMSISDNLPVLSIGLKIFCKCPFVPWYFCHCFFSLDPRMKPYRFKVFWSILGTAVRKKRHLVKSNRFSEPHPTHKSVRDR